ncbi:proline racemase family protein [Aestuariispira insulae]|uniref:Proline racemase n=1 Tax=Aestuariispira insulae TaxID=1461337 RepID=A0A3D9HVD5_9PROT|nr:proline racemase family protein [Aestuariispira insulae]RED53452.1 proline racemase [Aestuariispira insulae]
MSILPEFETVEMHTGGEPVRIILKGYPDIPGTTILEKRRYAKEHLDHFRQFLMYEPRGHYDMYGVIPVSPSHPDAHLAVLFIHNEGYSTMCGHATIALGRFAVDQGIVPPSEPYTDVNIECPCGLVQVRVEVKEGRAGNASFLSVPAFSFANDLSLTLSEYGEIRFDIGYGGAFYALADAGQFGLDIRNSRTRDLVDAATALTERIKSDIALSHPDDPDLAFLYGTILTDGSDSYGLEPTANICVFANAQVDRSPTGSGVTARMAVQYSKDLVRIGQERRFESVTGALFTAAVNNETSCGDYPAVRVLVSGKSFYSGSCHFIHETDDTVGAGFLLR